MSQLEERYKQYASDIKRNTEIAMDALDYILKCYVLMAHEESDGVYRQEEFDALEEAINAFFFSATMAEVFCQTVDYLTLNTLEGGFQDEQKIQKMLDDLGFGGFNSCVD